MLAVQGPNAREVMGSMAQGDLPKRFQIADMNLGPGDALVCGTGYTGEDGFEMFVDPASAAALWEELVVAGAVPAGLGARDTLRLEVNYALYGNDLDEEHNPIESSLGWIVEEHTGFIGSERCAEVREAGPERLLKPLVLDEGIPRQGNAILSRRRAGRRRHQRHPLAVARLRHRDGVRPHRPGFRGHRDRDRRPRQTPPGPRREGAALRRRLGVARSVE